MLPGERAKLNSNHFPDGTRMRRHLESFDSIVGFCGFMTNLCATERYPRPVARLACPRTDKHLAAPDLNVVFSHDEAHARAELLAT